MLISVILDTTVSVIGNHSEIERIFHLKAGETFGPSEYSNCLWIRDYDRGPSFLKYNSFALPSLCFSVLT